jgi:hypothetical protein
MPPQPQMLANDSVNKRQTNEGAGTEDGSVQDQSGYEEEEPWWRTFRLWKVNMRGLVDEGTS